MMPDWRKVKVLVCFYSRYGTTAKLAEAVAEGACAHPQDQVRLRRVRDLEPEESIQADPRWVQVRQELTGKYPPPTLGDLQWADVVILGSPAYFGTMAAALKHWIELIRPSWFSGAVEEKVGAAFCTSSTEHGGNEEAMQSMLVAMMHLGFVIVPSGYLDPPLRRNEAPYGAVVVSGPDVDQLPTEAELTTARALGYRASLVGRYLLPSLGEEMYRRHRPFPPRSGKAS